MADAAKGSSGALAACIVLAVLCGMLWLLVVASSADMASSDAAGNALAQGFAAIGAIALWVLLGLAVLLSFVAGNMPLLAALAAVILVPASGVAAVIALDLLSRPGLPPYLLPIVIPAGAPPFILLFCFWALLPALRSALPAAIAAGAVWGLVAVLTLAIVPLDHIRQVVDDQEAARLQKYNDDYARLPANAAMWDLVPFLATRNDTQQGEIADRIAKLPQRQSQAETMLDRGDFPLGFLGSFDLDPTPALCDKARALLRRRVTPLMPRTPGSEPYAGIVLDVADALAAMKWLVGYDCSCDAESQAWETMANAYRDPNFDVVELRELRDPGQLGRLRREMPARFSMLTPRAHLKAWLSYADQPAYRDQALAGARALDHRTADAVEMLTDTNDIGAPLRALQYLPVLDLDATAPLCQAALARVRDDIAKTYKPPPDDPRSYDELLSRLGGDEPLPALIWLADHGCDADADLTAAETLVRAYRDSAERAAMLASLAQAHRKP